MNATPTPAPRSPEPRRRNRLMLLALVAVFFVPILAAFLLNWGGALPPPKTNGEYLKPMRDLRALAPRLAEGGEYRWEPAARRWRVVIVPQPGCAEECVEAARKVDLVWQLLGKNADHVDILWLGAPPAQARRNAATRVLEPAPALLEALPRVPDGRGVPVYVIDPNGFVVLRYAPGFAPKGLLDDLNKLVKLM
ncbi:hypothetical protein [Luteimonas aquatica]|uniref:hypothetical protein n=1 Tax=Luteimonas aquatica TaxID=450364 RepID=UPI001F5ABDD8|nr:hypothetical protein [Luteimonas aquatica]